MNTFNDDYAGMSPLEEHLDFEAGAEDMELRAMRLEAERDRIQEMMFDAMDMEEERLRSAGGIVNNGDYPDDVRDTVPSPAPTSLDDLFGDDDIPF